MTLFKLMLLEVSWLEMEGNLGTFISVIEMEFRHWHLY